jgi:DNA polymerase III alpha subunit
MDEIPLLAARSHYSLMDGARSPEALCDFALTSGYACLSSMDAANLYALPAFADAADERGLKLLAGAGFERPGALPLYAWALNRVGFSRLCALISAEKAASPTGFLAVAEALCAGGWEGIALATADGALAHTLMAALARAEGPAESCTWRSIPPCLWRGRQGWRGALACVRWPCAAAAYTARATPNFYACSPPFAGA